jgi:import receptor subunit TOM70
MEKGEVEKAVQIFEKAEQVNPEDADLYYHRGQIRFLINDLPGSIQDYKKSIAIDPSCVYAFIQLGVAQYKQGEIQKSQRTFDQALKKFSDMHEVYNYHGEILLDQGKFDQGIFSGVLIFLALSSLNKAIEMEPKSPLAYINKAILLLSSKQDTEGAERECRKAVEVDPLSDIALSQLAQLLCHQNKIEEAIPFYDQAIKVTRTKNEIINVVSCREAAMAQLYVIKVIQIIAFYS